MQHCNLAHGGLTLLFILALGACGGSDDAPGTGMDSDTLPGEDTALPAPGDAMGHDDASDQEDAGPAPEDVAPAPDTEAPTPITQAAHWCDAVLGGPAGALSLIHI